MQVTLLDDHPDLSRFALRKVWVAARGCYSTDTPATLWEKSATLPEEKMLKVVRDQVILSGHLSCLRHMNLTYGISEISRACAAQLLRHHSGADWEQQSQRYCRVDTDAIVVPPSISKGTEENREHFDTSLAGSAEGYQELLDGGIPKEDARYVVPIGAMTNVTATLNLNALINICAVRLCTRSQWEVRRLVSQLRAVTGRHIPWLKQHLIIQCLRDGFCSESQNRDGHCTIRPHKDTLLEMYTPRGGGGGEGKTKKE